MSKTTNNTTNNTTNKTTPNKTNKTTNNTVSLSENVGEATRKFNGDVKALITIMNGKGKDARALETAKVNSAIATVGKSKNALNSLLAREYLLTHDRITTIKAGAVIPAKSVSVNMDENKVDTEDITVYPTLSMIRELCPVADVTIPGEKKARKYDIVMKVDVLRRVSAFCATGVKEYLTGKQDEKVNPVVLYKVKEMKHSKTACKALLCEVLSDICGRDIVKEVFSAMYADFERFILKRGTEWGTRLASSQSTVNDMVMEYTHLFLNGKTTFVFKYEEETK